MRFLRFLSPKVLFNLIRDRLGSVLARMGIVGRLISRIGGVFSSLGSVTQIFRRPKLLFGVIAGLLLLGAGLVVILPSPERPSVPVKQVKKVKTKAQLAAEAAAKRAAEEAERRLRLKLLADTKRILATEARKTKEAWERRNLAELNRKLKWIAHGNGRFWKVTRLGYEETSIMAKAEAKAKAKEETKKEEAEELARLFGSNAFPLGADEQDGTYTIGDDPSMASSDEKESPDKDWRKHIWTPKGERDKKKNKKKRAKAEPQVIPASFIYATFDSNSDDIVNLPPVVDRVFRHSRVLVVPTDFYDKKTREAMSGATFVEDFISLTAIIRGNMFGKVERIALRYRLPTSRLDRLMPWAVAALFNLSPTEGMRTLARRPFVEEALQVRAKRGGMPITSLETGKQYVKIHTDFTDREQVELLADAVRMHGSVEQYREAMAKAYLAGETGQMHKLYRERLYKYNSGLSIKILPRMLEKRSREMAASMIPQINRGRAFIAIPAINMPGSKGVLRQLTRRGYRVRYVETDPKKPMLVANPKYVNSPFFGDTLDPTRRKKVDALIAKKNMLEKMDKMSPKNADGKNKSTMKKADPRKTQKATKEPE